MPDKSKGKKRPTDGSPARKTVHTMLTKRKGRRTATTTVVNHVSTSHRPSQNTLASTSTLAAKTILTANPHRSSSPPTDGFGLPSSDFEFDFDQVDPNDEVFSHSLHEPITKRPRQSAFETWLPLRQKFLNRLFIHDNCFGLTTDGHCAFCNEVFHSELSEKLWRCVDCFHSPLSCFSCILSAHRMLPFHRIEFWNGLHWCRDELSRHDGYSIHVGHNGGVCCSPSRSDILTILHVNSIHHVRVQFCGCSTDAEDLRDYNQLLDARLFPATFSHPQTAFTFLLLDTLDVLTMRGKLSVYDYYHSLRSLTDACELQSFPRRYEELGVTVRRYRNLMALKRAGIAFKLRGVEDLQDGDLAIESPATPLPGKNLPIDWQTQYKDKPHLRSLFLALDANFRLKLKDRAIRGDAGLVNGSGYFVNQTTFNEELARNNVHPPLKDDSTCDSTFAAIERANSRLSRGYSVTGVVAAIDSRHGFVLPSAVANLQKGERYFNTDFVFLSSTRNRGVDHVLVSYDIACQWMRKLEARSLQFPHHLSDHLQHMNIVFAIPKFHLPAHGFSCQTRFSLNFIPGSARVDGEGIERLWAATNPVATSTREMASGTRHDFLEGRWHTQNFKKLVGLGESLSKKLRIAVEGIAKHSKELEELSAVNEEHIFAWREAVEAYHKDPDSSQDPYRIHSQEFTMADLVKEIRQEDSSRTEVGIDGQELSEVEFLVQGLTIEHDQRKLRAELKEKNRLTLTESRNIARRRAAIARRIIAWFSVQAVFMPAAIAFRSSLGAGLSDIQRDDHNSDEDDDEDEAEDKGVSLVNGTKAEDIDLLLPSSPESLATKSLLDKECRLRICRVEVHLSELRRLLRVKAGVMADKKANSVGQRAGTRSNTVLSEYRLKIDRTASYYTDERNIALRLDPSGHWQHRLMELKKADVRPIHANAPDEDARVAATSADDRVLREGQRSISWIWKVPRAVGPQQSVLSEQELLNHEEEKVDQAIQVEWARTFARVNRFTEEQELVLEEMKRVRRYFDWRRNWWVEKAHSIPAGTSSSVSTGLHAYAYKQVNQIEGLITKFVRLWRASLATYHLPSDSIDI